MESNDCPRCGCNDVQTSGRVMKWGGKKPWQRYQCNHCGKTWSAAPAERPEQEAALPVVTYFVTVCPRCGSEKVRITQTRRPKRYHECHACGKTFVSYEVRAETA